MYTTANNSTLFCGPITSHHLSASVSSDFMARKVFRIGTVRYHWPMSAHASQAFIIANCTDSEDLPMALYKCCYYYYYYYGVNGCRLEGFYIQKIHFNTFIYTLILIYDTPVSGANEISFVVINHYLIYPEFVWTMFESDTVSADTTWLDRLYQMGTTLLVKLNFLKS